jgi:hypothetical protein
MEEAGLRNAEMPLMDWMFGTEGLRSSLDAARPVYKAQCIEYASNLLVDYHHRQKAIVTRAQKKINKQINDYDAKAQGEFTLSL